MKKICFLIIILIALLGCDDTTKPDPNDSDITSIDIVNINPLHTKPYKIKYLFSLRDQNDHAVVIPISDFNLINYVIKEDSLEIDYSESNVFFKNSASFDMDIVLVLDFTLSMQNSGGTSEMVLGANAIIESLKDSHRVAIIEFHHNDPNDNYSIIQDFTYSKQQAKDSLQNFVAAGMYHGFSLCWDATALGLTLFDSDQEYDTVRAMVILTDGFDNNSITNVEDLILTANEKGVQMYSIGYGDITDMAVTSLQDMAESTNANFYQNDDPLYLDNEFAQIIADLGGNYMISYTTSNLTDFNVNIGLSYDGIEASNKISEDILISDIAGPITTGVLSYTNFILDNYQLDFDLQAEHLPAGIDSLRIFIDTFHDLSVTIVSTDDGGVISDWNIPNQGFDGYYSLAGTPTNIGEFGNLLHIQIDNINETNLNIPITIDNSIYPGNIFLSGGNAGEMDGNHNWTRSIIFGSAVEIPLPQNHETNVDTLSSLKWTYTNNSRNYEYKNNIFR